MSELPWEAAIPTASGISPLGKKQKSARGGAILREKYLALITLAAIRIWLCAYESAAWTFLLILQFICEELRSLSNGRRFDVSPLRFQNRNKVVQQCHDQF